MPNPSNTEVTALLLAWGHGDDGAFDRLVPMVHAELRRIARRHMEHDRAHFFAMSSRLMRRVLVDWARARGYQKRGAGAHNVTLDEARVGVVERPADLIALDDALKTLGEMDERKSQVVELRFFAGLSIEETAEALGHVGANGET